MGKTRRNHQRRRRDGEQLSGPNGLDGQTQILGQNHTHPQIHNQNQSQSGNQRRRHNQARRQPYHQLPYGSVPQPWYHQPGQIPGLGQYPNAYNFIDHPVAGQTAWASSVGWSADDNNWNLGHHSPLAVPGAAGRGRQPGQSHRHGSDRVRNGNWRSNKHDNGRPSDSGPPEFKWSVGLDGTEQADEDSDTVPVDPTDDMLDETETFLPTFLSRDLGDPLKENQTKTLGFAEVKHLTIGLNNKDPGPKKGKARRKRDQDTGAGTPCQAVLSENVKSEKGIDIQKDEEAEEAAVCEEALGGEHASAFDDDDLTSVPDSGSESESDPEFDNSPDPELVDLYAKLEGVPLNCGHDNEDDEDNILMSTDADDSSEPALSNLKESLIDTAARNSVKATRSKKKKRNRSKKKDADRLTWDDLIPTHDDIEAALAAESPDSFLEDDFDAADPSRPSLGNQFVVVPTRKRPAAFQRIQLSDDELQEKLEAAFNQNAEMKRLKNKSKQDALAKAAVQASVNITFSNAYPAAKTQIEEHIADFLLSDDNEFVFPFMPKFQRVIIHRVAVRAGLETSSHGKEPRRFTSLRKSARKTPECKSKEEAYKALRVGRRSKAGFKAGAGGYNGPGGRAGGSGKKGMAKNSTRYRNGDIVGADAEPIGEGSKGHAMLLKLGWQQGKPLGTSGAGLLEPIEQVVRLSRTGLG